MSNFGTVKIRDAEGSYITVQNPFPVDGDSVYTKDIDISNSYSTGWTASEAGNTFLDLFDCPNEDSGLYNDTVTNPKIIYIAFCRTVYLNAIGLGCHISGKTFSNTKIEFIGSDGTVRYTYDDSSNSTKYGTKLYSFAPTACIALKFSFATANTDVGLTNITIQKETSVSSRLRALKPDGTVTDIDATTGGNLKISLEELESGVSVNSNSQLRTTPYGLTSDSTWQVPRIDPATHTLQTIEYAHHEIHAGSSFFRKDWIDLTNGQVYDFLFVVPDTTKWPHVVVEFSSEAESNIKVYEATTASNNGTAVTVFNRDRNSTTEATTLLYHTPTVSGGSEGTNIANYKLGAGKTAGGTDRANMELVLKRNTKYLVRITNDTVSNNWFAFLVDWYEHTNKTA